MRLFFSPGRSRVRVLVCLLFAALLAGCDLNLGFNPLQVDTKPTPTPAPPPTPTHPPSKPGVTLTVRLASDASTLNPWLAGEDNEARTVTGLIFGGLTRIDDHLQPQPGLADSWDISPD